MQDPKSRINRLGSVILKGQVLEDSDQWITISTEGAMLTVSREEIIDMKKGSDQGETEIMVAPTAHIIYEALVSPVEAKGILSKEVVVEILDRNFIYRGECECSRCTGGECECSRCVDYMGRLGRYAYRGECECSRCTGGECECSRCVDFTGQVGLGELSGFRRRMT